MLYKGGSNFEKSSRVWYIFSEAIFCPEKENENLKIFGWEKSPLEYHIFWKKHPRKKWQKIDPHYFSIYFLQFFPKTTLSALKLQFVEKYLLLTILGVLELKITVLGLLEGLLEKVMMHLSKDMVLKGAFSSQKISNLCFRF